jgi:hypothetical protein
MGLVWQCLWRCYAADRSFNSQATWKIHLKVERWRHYLLLRDFLKRFMYGKPYSKYNGNIIIMLYKIYLLLFQEASSTSSLNWKGVAKAGQIPTVYNT